MYTLSKPNIIKFFLRLLVGGVFIFSGFSKLYPIEPFEFSIVETGVFSWTIVSYISRLFIASEIILGVLLIFNIYPKLITKFILGLLVFFSIYLLYLFIKEGNDADCGCFGSAIELNPIQSIIKNLILILFSIPVLYQKIALKFRFQKLIVTVFTILVIAVPFILNPIFIFDKKEFTKMELAPRIELDSLGEFIYNDTIYDLSKGKKIICFLSLKCKYCKLSAHKLTIIQEKINIKLPVFLVFVGDSDNFDKFFNESKSEKFPNMIVEKEKKRQFYKVAGTVLPAITFVEDGKVLKMVHFIDLEQSDVELFLNL